MELFARHGFRATTTAQVARAAGVSEMTLFRHFPTKEHLLLGDSFDPLIAEAVRERPASESPMQAVSRGLACALETLDESAITCRLRLVADAGLSANVIARHNEPTVVAIAEALVARGESRLRAQVIAAAAIAGLSEGLLVWAAANTVSLRDAIAEIFRALDCSC